jgi:hypothetical protein
MTTDDDLRPLKTHPDPPLLTNLSLTEDTSLRLLFKTIVFSTPRETYTCMSHVGSEICRVFLTQA